MDKCPNCEAELMADHCHYRCKSTTDGNYRSRDCLLVEVEQLKGELAESEGKVTHQQQTIKRLKVQLENALRIIGSRDLEITRLRPMR
jgi:hypothetical protein